MNNKAFSLDHTQKSRVHWETGHLYKVPFCFESSPTQFDLDNLDTGLKFLKHFSLMGPGGVDINNTFETLAAPLESLRIVRPAFKEIKVWILSWYCHYCRVSLLQIRIFVGLQIAMTLGICQSLTLADSSPAISRTAKSNQSLKHVHPYLGMQDPSLVCTGNSSQVHLPSV